MNIWKEIGFDGIWVDPVSPKSPSAAAKDLKAKSRIVITVDAAYPGSRSTKYAGIEVMLWLRLREKYTGPILLVGFQTAEAILAAHPEHLALLAPGNRYERLPISEGIKENVKSWLATAGASLTAKNLAEKYKPYLASAFDIGSFRHRMANIYGLKVMWDAMKKMRPSFGMVYPAEVARLEREDLHVRLGFELLGVKKELPPAAVGTSPEPTTPRLGCATLPGLQLCYVDDFSGLGWSEYLQHMVYGAEERNVNVFHRVDVQQIGRDNADLPSKVTAVINEIKANIKGKHALLLDLKLFPKHDDTLVDIASLSGAMVLQEIRKRERSLPIMVITASNKIWSYEDAMKLGADGYWVKPGLDDSWSEADAAENAQRLRCFLAATQHPMVLAQETLEATERRIREQGGAIWWARGAWPYGIERPDKSAEICTQIGTALDQLRVHNQRYTYDDRHPAEKVQFRSLSGIAMTLGVAFESIVGGWFGSREVRPEAYNGKDARFVQRHRCGQTNPDWDVGGIRDLIYKPRNKASHPRDQDPLKSQDLVQQVEALNSFLLGPEPRYAEL